MPHLKINGVDWFFHVEGQGPTLVLIHGWSVDHKIWRQQSKEFSKSYQVISIDLPGHGRSHLPKNLSIESMAIDILEVLRQQNVGKFHVVGSSLGGNVALEIYAAAPERILSLTLVGTMPKFYASENYNCGISLERKEKLMRQLFHAYPSIVEIFFRSLFTDEERGSRRYKWIQTFRREERVPQKQLLIDYLIMMEDIDQRDILKSVKCPTLVVNGVGDEICDPKTVDYMKQNIKHAKFKDLHGLGHFPFLSDPYSFNDILSNFLKNSVGWRRYVGWF